MKEEFKNKDVLMEEHIYESSSAKALDEAEQKYQVLFLVSTFKR